MKSKTYLISAICLITLLTLNTKVQATIDSITTSGFTFSPANITITSGDTVRFWNMSISHPVAQDGSAWTPFTVDQDIASEITTPGTYPFYCTVHGAPGGVGMSGVITVVAAPPVTDSVYVNEIHYDNVGGDVAEGVEVAGPAGTDLSCYTILRYNGSDSLEDPGTVLSGIIPNLGCGYGVVWFPISGLQNGPADAIGLHNTCNADVVQFLSYEGVITALDGPASGMTSVDIGVAEVSSPVGTSLQLIGTGTQYSDFTWSNPITATPDQINTGQIFCAGDTIIAFVGSGVSVNEDTGTVTIELSIVNPSPTTSFTVDVVYSTGSATITSDFTFATQTVTFPANDSTNKTVTITIIDDALPENSENIVLILQNPSAGITLGPDSVYTVTIKGNDIVLAPCTDLFFSEYVEGTSNNKAVEIYNPRTDTVDLANYTFLRRNGGSVTVNSYTYTGMLAPGDVFVVVNSGADSLNLLILGDTASTLTFFNGNDALAIVNTISGDTIDKFGEWGVDPGTNWPVDTGATSEYTLVRKAAIQAGELYWSAGASEWDVYAQDDFTNIGSHTMTPCSAPATIANFSNTIACLGDPTCFTDLSIAGEGAIASWFWDFGDGVNSTNQNPCHFYTAPGIYTATLIAVDDSSNGDTISVAITIDDVATVSAGPDQTVCSDVTTCIPLAGSVSGTATTGMWSTLGTGVFSPSDTDLVACYTPSALDTAMGSICLVLTSTNNGNCPAVMDTVCITFTPKPQLSTSVVIDSSSCGNSDGNISGIVATGAAPLSFSWVDGASSPVANTLDLLLVPSDCYTLTLTDGNGCTASSGPHCIVDAGAPAIPTAGGGGFYCDMDPIADLTATGSGGTLFWYADAALTIQVGIGSPFASGTFVTDTFYVAEMGACLGPAAPVIITVNPPLWVGVTPFNFDSACYGEAYTLTAISTGGTAPLTYVWDFTADTSAVQIVNATSSSVYNVYVEDAVGCTSFLDSVSLTVSPPLVATATDVSICAGDSINLTVTASGGSGAPYNYAWSPGGGTTQSISVSPAVSTAYTCIVGDGCSSDDMVTVNVTVSPAPNSDFSFTEVLLDVTFTDLSTIGVGSNIVNWSWDFGDTASGGNNTSTLQNPSHPFSAAGSYSVTLTTVSDGGCASVITYTVTVTAVGIEEFIYDQVSIFPNPTADGIINIQLSADLFKGASLRVFDVYGELILSRTIARQGSEMVNLSNQSAGVYMINIATDHGTVTKRIVIF